MSETSSLDKAFDMLLLKPLKQLEKSGGITEPIIVLIDALDEAEVCIWYLVRNHNKMACGLSSYFVGSSKSSAALAVVVAVTCAMPHCHMGAPDFNLYNNLSTCPVPIRYIPEPVYQQNHTPTIYYV